MLYEVITLPFPLAAPRPVNAECFAPNLLLPHIPPKSAVQALVAIVAHHEIGPLRHRHRPEVVSWVDRAIDNARIDTLREGLVIKRRPVYRITSYNVCYTKLLRV